MGFRRALKLKKLVPGQGNCEMSEPEMLGQAYDRDMIREMMGPEQEEMEAMVRLTALDRGEKTVAATRVSQGPIKHSTIDSKRESSNFRLQSRKNPASLASTLALYCKEYFK
ncbi:uncharacterized protein MEPE_06746 [Melanopsichium pennsylvanicum]|uniref:Uncharacterized protein n=1 Tax=Melanopsichium pennsylvanicum TaxID=63383 RepID=A0AAJ5C8I2_9BASI|nr:uncharacterized protein MEPE_06746 [Melanopsichium pennsylvanicum]